MATTKETKKEKKPAKKPAVKKAEKVKAEEPQVLEQQEAVVESTETEAELEAKKNRYYEAVGRRKNARARARLFLNLREILVNKKPYLEYFKTEELAQTAVSPLHKMKVADRMGATFQVEGGGLKGQAEAARHALSRALVKYNADYRKRLKKAGFLKRDPRMKERKKYGYKKARRAPQWAKR